MRDNGGDIWGGIVGGGSELSRISDCSGPEDEDPSERLLETSGHKLSKKAHL